MMPDFLQGSFGQRLFLMSQFFKVNKPFITVIKAKAMQMIPETAWGDGDTPLAETVGIEHRASHGILPHKIEKQLFLAESDLIGHPGLAFGLGCHRTRFKKLCFNLVERGSAYPKHFTGLRLSLLLSQDLLCLSLLVSALRFLRLVFLLQCLFFPCRPGLMPLRGWLPSLTEPMTAGSL